jgi:hypothetical protein
MDYIFKGFWVSKQILNSIDENDAQFNNQIVRIPIFIFNSVRKILQHSIALNVLYAHAIIHLFACLYLLKVSKLLFRSFEK